MGCNDVYSNNEIDSSIKVANGGPMSAYASTNMASPWSDYGKVDYNRNTSNTIYVVKDGLYSHPPVYSDSKSLHATEV